MPFDPSLAQRIEAALEPRADVAQKKMFGGLTFMVRGHMCCGVLGETLVVRVGADGHQEALSRPHARPMDFTGRPSKNMVYVDPAGYASDGDLNAWIARGLAFVETLPAK